MAGVPAEETVEASRARYDRVAGMLSGPPEPVDHVHDAVAGGSVSVRVYEPDGATGTLLYLHGGGWVLGSLESHDALCRALARRSGARVVAADYRLAPEHPFPAAVEDASAALAWTVQTYPGPVAVGGDSAGGALAAVLAREHADRVVQQLLLYPVTDARARHDAAAEGGLTRADMDDFWAAYGTPPDDPGASPAAAEDIGGLPPALLILADVDPVRPEAEAYAARLDDARVLVVPGSAHGFMRWGGIVDSAHRAIDDAAGALRGALSVD